MAKTSPAIPVWGTSDHGYSSNENIEARLTVYSNRFNLNVYRDGKRLNINEYEKIPGIDTLSLINRG